MAIVEDCIEDDELRDTSTGPRQVTLKDLLTTVARLELPAELLRVDQDFPKPIRELDEYRFRALQAVQDLRNHLDNAQDALSGLDDKGVADLVYRLVRLDGEDEWCSEMVRGWLRECVALLPVRSDTPRGLLLHHIKPLFSAHTHPDINPETARRLQRPAGGEVARSDMYEGQKWKGRDGWGAWNVVRWAAQTMSPAEVKENIGLILPPLLIMLDDYETVYRLRGMAILSVLLDRLDAATMQRMGLDVLFRQTLQRSIALHPTHPHPIVLPQSLRLLLRVLDIVPSTAKHTAERAKQVAEAVDKGLVSGWTYAASGIAGTETIRGVCEGLEILCGELGVEAVRWLKSFIPSLLAPLFIPPSPMSVAQQIPSLNALLALLKAIRPTGRSARWRGQILNAIGRAWVGASERLDVAGPQEDEPDLAITADNLKEVQQLCIRVCGELLLVAPMMAQDELLNMLAINERAFEPLTRAVLATQ